MIDNNTICYMICMFLICSICSICYVAIMFL